MCHKELFSKELFSYDTPLSSASSVTKTFWAGLNILTQLYINIWILLFMQPSAMTLPFVAFEIGASKTETRSVTP